MWLGDLNKEVCWAPFSLCGPNHVSSEKSEAHGLDMPEGGLIEWELVGE